MSIGHALLRFWWVVLLGLVAGVLAAVVVYEHESGKKYTGTASLFVNAPSAPYLRTQETQTLQQAPKLKTVRTKVRGRSSPTVTLKPVAQSPSVTSEPPDT